MLRHSAVTGVTSPTCPVPSYCVGLPASPLWVGSGVSWKPAPAPFLSHRQPLCPVCPDSFFSSFHSHFVLSVGALMEALSLCAPFRLLRDLAPGLPHLVSNSPARVTELSTCSGWSPSLLASKSLGGEDPSRLSFIHMPHRLAQTRPRTRCSCKSHLFLELVSTEPPSRCLAL